MSVYHLDVLIHAPQSMAEAYRYCLETYASETNKLVSTWLRFTPADWDFRSHSKSASVGEIMKHQLLSERRFFAFQQNEIGQDTLAEDAFGPRFHIRPFHALGLSSGRCGRFLFEREHGPQELLPLLARHGLDLLE